MKPGPMPTARPIVIGLALLVLGAPAFSALAWTTASAPTPFEPERPQPVLLVLASLLAIAGLGFLLYGAHAFFSTFDLMARRYLANGGDDPAADGRAAAVRANGGARPPASSTTPATSGRARPEAPVPNPRRTASFDDLPELHMSLPPVEPPGRAAAPASAVEPGQTIVPPDADDAPPAAPPAGTWAAPAAGSPAPAGDVEPPSGQGPAAEPPSDGDGKPPRPLPPVPDQV